jgi:hypothetical protein
MGYADAPTSLLAARFARIQRAAKYELMFIA